MGSLLRALRKIVMASNFTVTYNEIGRKYDFDAVILVETITLNIPGLDPKARSIEYVQD